MSLTTVRVAAVRDAVRVILVGESGACLAMFANDSCAMRYSANPAVAETWSRDPLTTMATFISGGVGGQLILHLPLSDKQLLLDPDEIADEPGDSNESQIQRRSM